MRHLAAATLAGLILAHPVPGQSSLSLTVTQPGGPGTFLMQVSGASPNAELYNLVSLVPHTPTGGGPFLGLGLGGADELLDQLLSPLPTPPFHVNADGSGDYTFSFSLQPASASLPLDLVSFTWDPVQGVTSLSPTVFIDLQL